MSKETIPALTRYRLLERAQQICDLAKVDHWEYSEMLSTMRELMEISYRAHEHAGDHKDDAEAKALKEFEPVEAVARVHRGGWRGLWHRLLFNQNYAVHRLLAPVVFCMLHLWLKTTGTLQVTVFASGDFSWRIALFGDDFYTGVMITVIVVVTRVAVRYLRVPKVLAELIGLGFALYLFSILAIELRDSAKNWFFITNIVDGNPQWKNNLVATVYLVGYMIEAISFFVVVSLAAAEILNVSDYYRAVIDAKRRRNPAKCGPWAWNLTNCFKFLAGQWTGLTWQKIFVR